MIVPMKKASIILLDRYREQSLTDLRRLGLLHIETRHATSEELARLLEEKNQIERSFMLLPALEKQKDDKKKRTRRKGRKAAKAGGDGEVSAGEGARSAEPEGARRPLGRAEGLRLAAEASECAEKMRGIEENLDRLQKERQRLAPWGLFDPEDVRELRSAGIYLRLYDLSDRRYRELTEQAGGGGHLFVLSRERDRVRLAGVYLSAEDRLTIEGEAVEEFPIPERGEEHLRRLVEDANAELAQVRERLEVLARQREQLRSSVRALEGQIEFERVRAGVTEAEELSHLTGYLPAAKVDVLRQAASGQCSASSARWPATGSSTSVSGSCCFSASFLRC
jgi:V/A-type H+-transporting ATPase subunit I